MVFAYILHHVFVKCTIYSRFIMCDYTNPKPIYFRCYIFDMHMYLNSLFFLCCRFNPPTIFSLLLSYNFSIFSQHFCCCLYVCGSWLCILDVVVLLCVCVCMWGDVYVVCVRCEAEVLSRTGLKYKWDNTSSETKKPKTNACCLLYKWTWIGRNEKKKSIQHHLACYVNYHRWKF